MITEVVGRHVGGGADLEAYLWGRPGMVDPAFEVLRGKAIAEERIVYDKFA